MIAQVLARGSVEVVDAFEDVLPDTRWQHTQGRHMAASKRCDENTYMIKFNTCDGMNEKVIIMIWQSTLNQHNHTHNIIHNTHTFPNIIDGSMKCSANFSGNSEPWRHTQAELAHTGEIGPFPTQ